MPVRIAIAASKGSDVVQHFGTAKTFLVYDVEAQVYHFVETRSVTPFCGEGRGNDDGPIDAVVQAIGDCKAVLAAAVGPCGLRALARGGLKVYEAKGSADEAAKVFAEGHHPF